MPEYLSPGVYVEEIDAGPQPISAVATSTAGAVGVTRKGPITPQLITSYGDFLRLYGGPLDIPDEATQSVWGDRGQYWRAAESVKAFFDEGGARMYFQRVQPGGAVASSRAFNGGLVALVQTDVAPTSTTIGLSHVVGIANGNPLDVVSDDGSVLGTVTVASVNYRDKSIGAERGSRLRGAARAGPGGHPARRHHLGGADDRSGQRRSVGRRPQRSAPPVGRSTALARRLEHQRCACPNHDDRGRSRRRDLDHRLRRRPASTRPRRPASA